MDVSVSVPLPDQAAGGDVDLLYDRVQQGPVARPSNRREVRLHRGVDRDERVALRRDRELVQVGLIAIGRAYGLDDLVGVVEHHVVPRADAAADEALPEGQIPLTSVFLDAGVEAGLPAGQ